MTKEEYKELNKENKKAISTTKQPICPVCKREMIMHINGDGTWYWWCGYGLASTHYMEKGGDYEQVSSCI